MEDADYNYDRTVAFLKTRRTELVAHTDGSLLDHLIGTHNLLQRWGSPTHLCLAGLCHTAYGTEGFSISLFHLSDRERLIKIIGPTAEQIVYFYASCDRRFLYSRIAASPPISFRDRFTGQTFVPQSSLLESFFELTFANELEIVRASPTRIENTRGSIGSLFEGCQGLVSKSAFTYFRALYGRPADSSSDKPPDRFGASAFRRLFSRLRD